MQGSTIDGPDERPLKTQKRRTCAEDIPSDLCRSRAAAAPTESAGSIKQRAYQCWGEALTHLTPFGLWRLDMRFFRRLGALAGATASASARLAHTDLDEDCGVHYEQGQVLTNWSSTHTSHPRRVYEPKSAQEVVRVLQQHHRDSSKVRPVGTALSPNGMGLCSPNNDLMSLAHIDYVEVDVPNRTVTCGAGARVSSVLAELAKHGLTLSNFSSIQEQQMGGWTQISAHGTGVTLPPVDEMVLRLRLATPTEGLMTLSAAEVNAGDDWLFRYAKVGLGSLGVVTELTLQAIPKFNLEEETFCLTRDAVGRGHAQRLRQYRHVRYMWIPYTDTVVVVVSNPTNKAAHAAGSSQGQDAGRGGAKKPTEALCALLASLSSKSTSNTPTADHSAMSFSQLRDALLDHAPLDVAHIKAVNAAEAAFWRASTGTRVADSTEILGFDCGGEQLVYEVCVGMGPLSAEGASGDNTAAETAEPKDIALIKEMLAALEAAQVPAPSPIEQRWSARSSAPMSPAFSLNAADVFTWVGIIMYLPPGQAAEQRAQIAAKFEKYCRALQPVLQRHGPARVHWAKIEPSYSSGSSELAAAFGERLHEFNSLRDALDPRRVLTNDLMDNLIGRK